MWSLFMYDKYVRKLYLRSVSHVHHKRSCIKFETLLNFRSAGVLLFSFYVKQLFLLPSSLILDFFFHLFSLFILLCLRTVRISFAQFLPCLYFYSLVCSILNPFSIFSLFIPHSLFFLHLISVFSHLSLSLLF